MAERAAELSKCDLLTALVGEFPELQGVMGGYYALADGEAAEVAAAIREHYLPRGAGDALPSTDAGSPSASRTSSTRSRASSPSGRSPPARRIRSACVARPSAFCARSSRSSSTSTCARSSSSAVALQPVQGARVADEIYDYVMERLRAYYLDSAARRRTDKKPITTEMFDAVLATQPRSPLDFDARLRALQRFLELPEAASLTAANKRIANILRKSESIRQREVDVEALREPAEVRLYRRRARRCATPSPTATARREYAAALGQLAQLRPAVDGFFDQVMVMAEDPKLRANRLALLSGLRDLFGGVADLSRLPG